MTLERDAESDLVDVDAVLWVNALEEADDVHGSPPLPLPILLLVHVEDDADEGGAGCGCVDDVRYMHHDDWN